jgi:hypothetical protein
VPSVATLGRAAQAAAERATALLEVLDEAARPKVTQGAFDEIFVAQTPVLMGVEPASLCWVLGQRAENRDGQTWAREFQKFPSLEHAISDAGSGLMKGLALANASRSEPAEHSLDVFHTLYEGGRAWRMTESRVWKLGEQAQQAGKLVQRLKRRGKSLQGHGPTACRARYQAERALDAAVEIETAWQHVRECLELFTPEGQLNTHSAARAKLEQWLPELKGAQWAKTIRLLKRPESLTFLKRIERQLRALPIEEHLKQDALRFEGLRRRPKLLEGEDLPTRATRGWWLLATLRYHRDEEFQKAVSSVRGILRDCWRASSLVEGINSVVRMQQARHRKLTPGLIALKRFYWNCRRFRTGQRKNHSPYELLGLRLPSGSWWDILKLSPDSMRQELSTQSLAL